MIDVAWAKGDGIGPEIMSAVRFILNQAKAPINWHEVEIGEQVYLKGFKTGIDPKTWDILRDKPFLKAPITTPQGGGFKSLNVTIRGAFNLFANVRPCTAYSPFVHTKHPDMNVVIIRENEEDLYSGIEYRQTPDVCHSVKLISRQGSRRIVRYAFEYAQQNNRKKVTCFTKDNIMKFSDGLFHQVFEEVAKEYPDIESEHWIVDIGAAKLADTPENFDVVVLPNLYGDILSDVAAQISGSVGMAGSANIGDHGAMFEAIHGSAPRRAGQNVANPSGLLNGAILMLIHIGLTELATTIENAWLKTIEDGIHTYDIFEEGTSKEKVGTKEFAEAIAARLGQTPSRLPLANHTKKQAHSTQFKDVHDPIKRELQGVDVYVHSPLAAQPFIEKLNLKARGKMELKLITNRGVVIWPEGQPETFCIEQYRLRFVCSSCDLKEIASLLMTLDSEGLDVIKCENLYTFDGAPGYSHAQI